MKVICHSYYRNRLKYFILIDSILNFTQLSDCLHTNKLNL